MGAFKLITISAIKVCVKLILTRKLVITAPTGEATSIESVAPAGMPAGTATLIDPDEYIPLATSTVGFELGLADGLALGSRLGFSDGLALGLRVGLLDGLDEGLLLGLLEGAVVGATVGAAVGFTVGAKVGFEVGAAVGFAVGVKVGFKVGAAVGFAVGGFGSPIMHALLVCPPKTALQHSN